MSFREKSTWITLITLVLMSLVWLAHLPWQQPFTLAPAPHPIVFHGLVYTTISFVVIVVIAHIVVALRSPRDAGAPADERERLIGLKATRLAARVYVFMSLSSVALIHLGANQIGVAYFIVVSFVVAEIVNCVARIVFHRHGV